jgi:two-component system phosphate regulon response regulator PhoB
LRQAGYRTVHAANAAEALTRAKNHQPDLILLDLNLPDFPGTDVCKQIKSDPVTQRIPVIMLTARTGESDRIAGFELGADDYVVKPFSVRELTLRLAVAWRRGSEAAARHGGARYLRSGPIEMDREAFIVRVDGVPLPLALLEFRLLAFLMEGEGRVRTREELLHYVWSYPANSDSRTIETHVKRLRAKLGAAGELIETVRSVGYRMRVAAAPLAAG